MTDENKVPIDVMPPAAESVKNLHPDEILSVAQHYGLYPEWRDLWYSNQKYTEKMYGIILSDVSEIDEKMSDVVKMLSNRREALSGSRDIFRQYQQIVAVNGNPDQILVRIGEGDDAMCNGCVEKEGFEGTYEEHSAEGLPGTQECGSNCRCVLIPVDSNASGPAILGEDESLRVISEILE